MQESSCQYFPHRAVIAYNTHTMAHSPVELIKERLSILDVVGQYVELQRAGKSFKGKSPFTNEKTPSFFVSPDRGMYYCFSSQKGGDMFTFIEEMEGVDFKGALKILAEKANVELVAEDPQKRDERETQYALLEEATQYFFKSRDEFEHVNTYIANRGVTGTTIHAWRIGYARDEWRSLKAYLAGKGFTEAHMLAAGLIKKTDPNKESYDVFRDRIMFPIADASGRVVAFSGRTLKNEAGIPKYVNSPETDLFKKSEILYGYDKAKHGIRHYDFSLVVEGQFDLVLAHQAGYGNTVAVSGTALTAHHLMLLERLSNRIVLALDSDRAGIAAVKRSSGLMLEHGMDVKVARMEGGKDPADIIKENPQNFKHFVGKAVHVIDFLLAVLGESSKDERTYKLRAREEILPLLAPMPNRIDREHFEGVVAQAVGTTKDAIHYEVERILAVNASGTQQKAHSEPKSTPVSSVNRKQALLEHLHSLTVACDGERAWLGEKIREHLKTVLSAEEFAGLERSRAGATDGTFFITEQSLLSVSDRQLLEDISDRLTTLTHIIARERLAQLGVAIRSAEAEGNESVLVERLKETKDAERLLQSKIVISGEVQ